MTALVRNLDVQAVTGGWYGRWYGVHPLNWWHGRIGSTFQRENRSATLDRWTSDDRYSIRVYIRRSVVSLAPMGTPEWEAAWKALEAVREGSKVEPVYGKCFPGSIRSCSTRTISTSFPALRKNTTWLLARMRR